MARHHVSQDAEQRRAMLAKAGGAAAFALLVMWMTPPTTPHPLAPSPLEMFRKIRSDAPERDSAALYGDGSYYASAGSVAPVVPWVAAPAPLPRSLPKIADGAASYDRSPADQSYVAPDDPPRWPDDRAGEGRVTLDQPRPASPPVQPQAASMRHAPADPQYSYEQRRSVWLAEMDRNSAGDADLGEDDPQE